MDFGKYRFWYLFTGWSVQRVGAGRSWRARSGRWLCGGNVPEEYKAQVLPKSPIGKAIAYSLNQWEALSRYVDDPLLEIDNNVSERTLRMVVIGRKNYLFAGSEAGAWRAALIYSLVASCKLNGVDSRTT